MEATHATSGAERTTHPTTEAGRTVEFYLPATFQFSPGPGRIERFLGRFLAGRDLGERPTAETESQGFYLPGTPSSRPGPR